MGLGEGGSLLLGGCGRLPNQPQRGQVMVCEHIDAGLLGEGLLPLMNEARVKMCNAMGHQVIPHHATIWAAAFEFGENLASVHGFDLSLLNDYRDGNMVDLDGAI